jgi:hypothetical protein
VKTLFVFQRDKVKQRSCHRMSSRPQSELSEEIAEDMPQIEEAAL